MKEFKASRFTSILGRRGDVALPIDMMNFRVGQRVYFRVEGGQGKMAALPLLTEQARYLSRRLRMGRWTRNLAARCRRRAWADRVWR